MKEPGPEQRFNFAGHVTMNLEHLEMILNVLRRDRTVLITLEPGATVPSLASLVLEAVKKQ
jgi:hypothetical protein